MMNVIESLLKYCALRNKLHINEYKKGHFLPKKCIKMYNI